MSIETTKLLVLNPVVEPLQAHAEMAHRSESLDGMTVGLLSNGKRNADILLEHIVALMAEHYQIKDVVAMNKGNASRPCPDDMAQELLEKCDILMTATGD